MRKQMIENAAYEVATQVRAVEDSIDATLAEIAELQMRMMHVNSVARVGPAPIHAALTNATRSHCLMQPTLPSQACLRPKFSFSGLERLELAHEHAPGRKRMCEMPTAPPVCEAERAIEAGESAT